LNDQIQKQHDIDNGNSWKINYGKIKISLNYSTQAIVTKNQQAIRIRCNNSQSEESTMKILSMADAIKNIHKKIKINSIAEKIPTTVMCNNGSDQLFWNGTYVNVKNLYQRAVNNKILKTDDVDNYLVSKLINNTKWFTGGVLGSFLTDRMIVAIFLAISERK
jgi:hypothetical protein